MKREDRLLDYIGEIDSKYVEDALSGPSEAAQVSKTYWRKVRTKAITGAACLLLVLAAVFSVRFLSSEDNPGRMQTEAEDPAPESTVPPSESDGLLLWHGKSVQSDLSNALDAAAPGQSFTIHAAAAADPQSLYQGKTLQSYWDAADTLRQRMYQLEALQKEGPALQYGDVLCTDGLPDGTRWAEELYQERLAYYGDLLDRYIVDGTFLQAQAAADLEQCQSDADAAVALAEEAQTGCQREQLQTLYASLTGLGYPADLDADGTVLSLTITAEEFANLELPQSAGQILFCLHADAYENENLPIPE